MTSATRRSSRTERQKPDRDDAVQEIPFLYASGSADEQLGAANIPKVASQIVVLLTPNHPSDDGDTFHALIEIAESAFRTLLIEFERNASEASTRGSQMHMRLGHGNGDWRDLCSHHRLLLYHATLSPAFLAL